jgi:hypothetical protein
VQYYSSVRDPEAAPVSVPLRLGNSRPLRLHPFQYR